ncbi:MAG: hypothetical protein OER21_07585 [Gemmatimonadota bacterium]|nr:hypothetical protein [Gemmatimonadota bacterium]
MARPIVWTVVVVAAATVAPPPAVAQVEHREIKWMRDSEEYAALTRQIYRSAAEHALAAAKRLPRQARWTVVLDVDETTLDNSVYQLERAAYELPYDTASWNAWARRMVAPPVPGVSEFLTTVRRAGGRVAFISNRTEWIADPTRRNLAAHGLWLEGDLLCLDVPGETYTKQVRRTELRTGSGRCAWPEGALPVLAYLGDDLRDFPTVDEEPGAFGDRWFVLPNPTYGTWERGVTRRP